MPRKSLEPFAAMGGSLVQRLTGRPQGEEHVEREKMDASQIHSEQRGDGGGFAAGREKFETARRCAAILRLQSGAGRRSVLRGSRTLAERYHRRENRCAAARARHDCRCEDLRADTECRARCLALRCRRSLFGIHEDQSGWTRWTGWRAGISRRTAAGTSTEWPQVVRAVVRPGAMLPGPPPEGGPDGPGGAPMGGGPGGMPPKPHTTDDLVFLRGVQITDAHGVVEFQTIYPGHYPGRVNHIHMKVHVGGGATKATVADAAHRSTLAEVYAGGHVAHTGQLFFPEDVSRFVEATHPYSGRRFGELALEEDMVFTGQSGAGSVAKLTPVTSTQLSDGYVATLMVAVDPEATPKLVGFGGRRDRVRGRVGRRMASPNGPVGREERRGELASTRPGLAASIFLNSGWVYPRVVFSRVCKVLRNRGLRASKNGSE